MPYKHYRKSSLGSLLNAMLRTHLPSCTILPSIMIQWHSQPSVWGDKGDDQSFGFEEGFNLHGSFYYLNLLSHYCQSSKFLLASKVLEKPVFRPHGFIALLTAYHTATPSTTWHFLFVYEFHRALYSDALGINK